jgi:hypothetical protein
VGEQAIFFSLEEGKNKNSDIRHFRTGRKQQDFPKVTFTLDGI